MVDDREPLASTQGVEPDRAADRFVVLSSRMFRILGIFMIGIFGLELFSALTELRLRNPSSEIRFTSRMTDQIPVLLLGMTLLLCHPRRLQLKVEAWFLSWLGYGALVAMAAYLLSIPITTNAAIQIFRNNAFQMNERIKIQLERAKKVQEATLALTPEQQQGMVLRYNRANPKKNPIEKEEFLQLLDEEIKMQEAKLEQERRSLLEAQEQGLYVRQFLQTAKCLLGSLILFLIWKYSAWARPSGQKHFRSEAEGRRRWTY